MPGHAKALDLSGLSYDNQITRPSVPPLGFPSVPTHAYAKARIGTAVRHKYYSFCEHTLLQSFASVCICVQRKVLVLLLCAYAVATASRPASSADSVPGVGWPHWQLQQKFFACITRVPVPMAYSVGSSQGELWPDKRLFTLRLQLKRWLRAVRGLYFMKTSAEHRMPT